MPYTVFFQTFVKMDRSHLSELFYTKQPQKLGRWVVPLDRIDPSGKTIHFLEPNWVLCDPAIFFLEFSNKNGELPFPFQLRLFVCVSSYPSLSSVWHFPTHYTPNYILIDELDLFFCGFT